MTAADTNQVDYWEISADKDEARATRRAHIQRKALRRHTPSGGLSKVLNARKLTHFLCLQNVGFTAATNVVHFLSTGGRSHPTSRPSSASPPDRRNNWT